jgi:hypothetical protein
MGDGNLYHCVCRVVGNAPKEKHSKIMHSLAPEKLEAIKSLEGWASTTLLPYLKDVDKCWQPQDFLPEPSSEGFLEEVKELQERAAGLPDDYLVCLVGDMITEEALPTYQTMLNTLDGTRDETGASPTPWGIWTRAWTAEENRHGDLLNKYLYLTGRVDMRQVEKTIQYLIGSGMVREYFFGMCHSVYLVDSFLCTRMSPLCRICILQCNVANCVVLDTQVQAFFVMRNCWVILVHLKTVFL